MKIQPQASQNSLSLYNFTKSKMKASDRKSTRAAITMSAVNDTDSGDDVKKDIKTEFEIKGQINKADDQKENYIDEVINKSTYQQPDTCVSNEVSEEQDEIKPIPHPYGRKNVSG